MKLHQRTSPNATTLNVSKLVRAALLIGRGYPIDNVAAQLRIDRRTLRTELNRLGVDRPHAPHIEADPNLVLQMRLTRAERTTLGVAALDREMYRPALGCLILRTVLQGGPDLLDAVLDDGRRR